MNIHYVVSKLDTVGGPSYTMPMLAASAAAPGDQILFHSLAPPRLPIAGATVRTYKPSQLLARIEGSPALRAGLAAAARASPSIIHSNTIWSAHSLYAARAVRGTGSRHVVSPDGTLDPWAFRHHHLRKRAFWLLGQKAALQRADCIHAVTDREHAFIRGLGLRAPVAVIPWGVTMPERADRRVDTGARRKLLYLSRIHPKKGIDLLIRAWARVQDEYPDWQLDVVGPDNGGYLDDMRALATALRLERAILHGLVPEQAREDFYRSASLYVLPTHGESWGVTIADALAFGVAVIVGTGAPWEGVRDRDCGWWVEPDVDALVATLRAALATPPDELRAKGERGRAWMEACGWAETGAKMRAVYQWLLGAGPKPAWVRND